MTRSLLLATLTVIALLSEPCGARNLGAVASYAKTAHGVEGRTASASFSIDVYSAHIIRVRVAPMNARRHDSYALADNALPEFTGFSVEQSGRQIVVRTSAIIVEAPMEPDLRFRFKDRDGHILNEDMDGEGLGITFLGDKVTVYKALQEGERFIGMGEELGDLDRRGTILTLKNTDNYRYDDPRVPMYTSIPFFMGIHHQKLYGLFFNNTYRSVFNFGASNKRFASMSFDGGELDEFFVYDDSIKEILRHYTSLTGRMPLPPKWSLGYQQSRCSYYPEDRVMFVAKTFRDKQIPLDGIVLDADYLVKYEPFRIDTQRFPDMRKLADRLHSMNIELTASVNPGIAIDDSYAQHHTGMQQDVFLKFADGELYATEMAPNAIHLPDFSNPKARAWWIDAMKIYQELGINGYWNDMNEPAIDGQAIPDNVVFDLDGRKGSALEGQNTYGMLMARSSFESFEKYGGNKRPFVLSRSGFAGIQRYAAVWSGDNQAKDEHILLGTLLNNQMGLAGVPFVGPDLGGYMGDGNKELFRRWMEVGVFSPYLRNHREQLAAANEPWAYGEEAEAISKAYLGFRYSLMPYLYSTFYEAAATGMPISRSLSIEHPFDASVYQHAFQYEFQFGAAFLLNPMTSKELAKTTYLPAGEWYDLFTDRTFTGGRTITEDYPSYKIPIFIKASSIVPMQGRVQSTKDYPGDTLYVHVFNGVESSRFDYYDDDGTTLNYRSGINYRRSIEFHPSDRRLVFTQPQGRYGSPFKRIKIILHGFGAIRNLTANGHAEPMQSEVTRMFDPLDYLKDLYYDPHTLQSFRDREPMNPQLTVTVANTPQIVLRWDSP